MTLVEQVSGWHGGNAVWTTYQCSACDEEVHSTARDPDPNFCPYCGCPADSEPALTYDSVTVEVNGEEVPIKDFSLTVDNELRQHDGGDDGD